MKKRKPKLTPWFPMSTPPVRPGCYEIGTRADGGGVSRLPFPFHWFDGKLWTDEVWRKPPTEGEDKGEPHKPFYLTRAFWRGLAEEPK